MQLQKALTLGTILCGSLTLAGCQTLGSGTSNVTCETIRVVKLSRKDTAGTIQQVVPNNAALIAICGSKTR